MQRLRRRKQAGHAPRKSDAVVTVDHEVRTPELDGHDRRERAVGERLLERAEAVSAEGVKRAEVARECIRAAVRPYERIERNRANSQVASTERFQSPLDLVACKFIER